MGGCERVGFCCVANIEDENGVLAVIGHLGKEFVNVLMILKNTVIWEIATIKLFVRNKLMARNFGGLSILIIEQLDKFFNGDIFHAQHFCCILHPRKF